MGGSVGNLGIWTKPGEDWNTFIFLSDSKNGGICPHFYFTLIFLEKTQFVLYNRGNDFFERVCLLKLNNGIL